MVNGITSPCPGWHRRCDCRCPPAGLHRRSLRRHLVQHPPCCNAVTTSFLSVLEDPDFGYGNVTPRAMLTQVRNEYGTLTPEELDQNRAASSADPWKFDDPMKTCRQESPTFSPRMGYLRHCTATLPISPSSLSR